METYKKRAQDSQKEIRKLEVRNTELQSDLARKSSGGVILPPPKAIGGAVGSGDKDGYLRRHSTGPNCSKDVCHTSSGKQGIRTHDIMLPRLFPVSGEQSDADIQREAAEWIRDHINRLFFVKAARYILGPSYIECWRLLFILYLMKARVKCIARDRLCPEE